MIGPVKDELFFPQQAASRLGLSRQHVVRLIGCGQLEGQTLPGSGYWKISLASVLAFEERQGRHRELTAK